MMELRGGEMIGGLLFLRFTWKWVLVRQRLPFTRTIDL
jgi:hypothetical protein